MSKYISFQTEDFVLDEFFCSWVMNPTTEKNAFWEDFLTRHPHQHKAIEEARVLVRALKVNWVPVTEQQSRQSFQRLENKIFHQEAIPLWKKRAISYRVAAVVALLLVAISAWVIGGRFESKTTYQTSYGEIKTIILPDQSVVTLNANSRLTLPKKWNTKSNREVWLEGEAFFDVKHLKNHQKFLVHTTDKFVVEVLGTTFNVFERENVTRVVLESGKVKLNIGDGKDEKDVLMQPGEMVELQPNTGSYSKKRVNSKLASAWKEHKLIFDNTPISEIVSILEENYGLQVKVSHPEVLQKRVFGSCPTDDIDVLLIAVTRPFGLSVKRDGKKVTISIP